MRVAALLERGSPPRMNPIFAGLFVRLEQRGIRVTRLYPEEIATRLDTLRVEADLYLLKSDTELSLSLALALECLGARVLNAARASAVVKDKILAASVLAAAGIPAPAAFAAREARQLAGRAARAPLICKPVRGYHGVGVALLEGPGDGPGTEDHSLVFAQEYLGQSRTDLKIYGIGDQVFGVRKVFARDSYTQGGEPVALPPRLAALARETAAAFGLQLFGLDVAEQGDDYRIIDVNYFPGYRGVPAAAERLTRYITGVLAGGRTA